MCGCLCKCVWVCIRESVCVWVGANILVAVYVLSWLEKMRYDFFYLSQKHCWRLCRLTRWPNWLPTQKERQKGCGEGVRVEKRKLERRVGGYEWVVLLCLFCGSFARDLRICDSCDFASFGDFQMGPLIGHKLRAFLFWSHICSAKLIGPANIHKLFKTNKNQASRVASFGLSGSLAFHLAIFYGCVWAVSECVCVCVVCICV